MEREREKFARTRNYRLSFGRIYDNVILNVVGTK